MGSVVLEQLLRFAPDVARIYMLIRGKRGVTGALWLSAPSCQCSITLRPG